MWSSSRRGLLQGAGRRSWASQAVMTAAKVELASLPLVDVAPLLGAKPADMAVKARVLSEMRAACVNHGFFTVPVAGVLPKPLLEAAYRRADDFLALPDEVKMKYHNKKTPNNRGWTPMFEEPSYQPDVVSHLEGFDLARELPVSYIKEGSSLGPNTWPEELPEFRRDVYELYEVTTRLSHLLFESFAEMFGLPADTFMQHVSEEAEAFMRLLTYPEVDAPVKNSTVGIASHTDFECFTLIHQNGEGLHLLNRKGTWVEAPVCDDRIFVMVGDMLERWTNGVLVATEHRVVNSERKRQSIVRFNGADGDTVVAPLPMFVTAANPAKYDPTTQRQHIAEQIGLAEQLLAKTKAAQVAV